MEMETTVVTNTTSSSTVSATGSTEKSSVAWSSNAALYASSLSSIPGSISVAAAELLFPSDELRSSSEEAATAAAVENEIFFVDVAAGPGTLTFEVLDRLRKVSPSSRGKLLVTDFAPGMIEAAQQRAAAAVVSATESSSSESTSTSGSKSFLTLDYAVLDGTNLATVPTHTVTHAGCMFGIMFYNDVLQGLRELYRILIPTAGKCVIGTWKEAGAAHIANDFAAYLGLPSTSVNATPNENIRKLMKITEIGKNPDDLRKDLLSVGFRTVTIYTVPTMYRSTDYGPFLHMLRNNPAIGQFFTAAPSDLDWDQRWLTFLTDTESIGYQKYVNPVTKELQLQWIANVALAHA